MEHVTHTRLQDILPRSNKVSIKERIYFYQMLATTLDAGMSITQCIALIQYKIHSTAFKEVLSALSQLITDGDSLGSAMEKFPLTFRETETAIVRSGESTGNLDMVLYKLAQDLETTQEVQSRIKSALIYPVTVIVALLIASGFMIAMVIPQLAEIYRSNNAPAPKNVEFLSKLGTFLGTHPLEVIFSIFFLVFLAYSWTQTDSGKKRIESLLLRLPYFGTLYQKTILSRIARTLGMLMDSGLGILPALKLVSKVSNHHEYKVVMDKVRHGVEKGERISASMRKYPEYFPKDTVELLSVGEASAELGSITKKLATQYDRDVEYTMKNFMTILEPATIVVIAVFVVWFALTMLGAIFSLTDIFS